MSQNNTLKRTPLFALHQKLGARLAEFAGWEMPVWYSGILKEHLAVRTATGLFDVSHMGQLLFEGKNACAAVNRLITNDAAVLTVGQALYTVFCNERGGIIDDLVVLCMDEQKFLLTVNAACIDKDYTWIAQHRKRGDPKVKNASDEWALLALQGPLAARMLQHFVAADLTAIPSYRGCGTTFQNMRVFLTRTGYTGEDGFELLVPPERAAAIFDALLDAGQTLGIVPCGLGARDTLRLEAGMMLYGNDIDENRTPLEAPLSWTVKWEKRNFIGKKALEKQRVAGVREKLVGFIGEGREIARRGYEVRTPDGKRLGVVTSGGFSPTFEKSIGLAYIPAELSKPGTEISVIIRGVPQEARVIKLPFYKRNQKLPPTKCRGRLPSPPLPPLPASPTYKRGGY